MERGLATVATVSKITLACLSICFSVSIGKLSASIITFDELASGTTSTVFAYPHVTFSNSKGGLRVDSYSPVAFSPPISIFPENPDANGNRATAYFALTGVNFVSVKTWSIGGSLNYLRGYDIHGNLVGQAGGGGTDQPSIFSGSSSFAYVEMGVEGGYDNNFHFDDFEYYVSMSEEAIWQWSNDPAAFRSMIPGAVVPEPSNASMLLCIVLSLLGLQSLSKPCALCQMSNR